MVVIEKDLDATVVQFSGEMVDMYVLVVVDVVDFFCWMCALEAFVKCLQVPREALEIAEMSINFRSGKFGYSICPIFSKVMPKFTKNFGMTFA